MRMRHVGVVGLLVGCAVAKAAPPGRPGELTVTAVAAPGDTLAYTVSWTAPTVVAGQTGPASNYDFVTSVAGTNGVWTVVYGSTPAGAPPASGTTTGLLFTLKLIAIPWDSATFTVAVTARNAKGSAAPGTSTWKVLHGLRPPGPVLPPKVDSTATVTGMLVAPNPIGLALNASRVVCGFSTFASGAVASFTADRPACDSIRAHYVTSLIPVTPAQQAHVDSLSLSCVTWTTASPSAIGLVPRAPCASAVVVTGLALTRARGDQLPYHYVSLNDGLGPVVFTNPRTGHTTCLRLGLAYVSAIADNGRRGGTMVACNGPLPTILAALER
jgi:hypothetical protein